MRTIRAASCLLFLLCLSGTALQSQVLLRSQVLSAGASQCSGGGLTLSATLGQPVIGRGEDGVYAWQGFWAQRNGPGSTTAVGRLREGRGYVLHAGHPNPFSAASVIAIELHEAMPLRVEVCDLLGRPLFTAHESSGERGTVFVHIDGARLAEGQYFAFVTIAGTQHLLPLVLLR